MAATLSPSSPSISISPPSTSQRSTRTRGTTIVGTLPSGLSTSSSLNSSPGSPGSRVGSSAGSTLGSPPSFMRSKSMDTGIKSNSISASLLPEIDTSMQSSSSAASPRRPRSSSILSMHEIRDNADDDLDKSAFANLNADWVNYKGAWLIHIVLIVVGKVLVDSIPGIEQDSSWTIVLQSYLIATYVMFHFVEGVPFESNSGVYDRLTMWEQIDGGAQYTPTKKWLTSLPIVLFLLSTHYTRYDHHPALFSLNIISLIALALIPKLPQLHRQRLTFGPPQVSSRSEPGTGTNTPVETAMGRALLPSLPEVRET